MLCYVFYPPDVTTRIRTLEVPVVKPGDEPTDPEELFQRLITGSKREAEVQKLAEGLARYENKREWNKFTSSWYRGKNAVVKVCWGVTIIIP